MGTSTVTQDRQPQKVGEPPSRFWKKKRTKTLAQVCVKAQMMKRDCVSVSSLFSGKLKCLWALSKQQHCVWT